MLAFLLASTFQQATVPLIEGTGPYTRGVKSSHPLAAKYVDQGFAYMYGFQHDEATRSFAEAGRLDPNLLMAHLGVALSYGNHINNSYVSADRSANAIRALERARALRAKGTAVENDLVEAQFKRFDATGPSDRTKLNVAYADAMREVIRSGEFDTLQVPFNVLNPSAGVPGTADGESDYGNVMADCAAAGTGVFAIRVFAGGALLDQPPSAHTLKTPYFPLPLYERDRERAKRLLSRLGDRTSAAEYSDSLSDRATRNVRPFRTS